MGTYLLPVYNLPGTIPQYCDEQREGERTERGEGEVNKTKEEEEAVTTHDTHASVFLGHATMQTYQTSFKPYLLHTVVVKPTTCCLYYY